jgi:hypothetical protein
MAIETWNVDNAAKPTIVHDPNAVLDYSQDWSAWLAGPVDTITAHVVTPHGTMTLTHSENTDTTVTAWLTGGVVGSTESVTIHIVTAQGREDDRTLFFKIKER